MLVGLSLNKQPVAEQLAARPPSQQALVHTATMWLCDLCGAETMDQVRALGCFNCWVLPCRLATRWPHSGVSMQTAGTAQRRETQKINSDLSQLTTCLHNLRRCQQDGLPVVPSRNSPLTRILGRVLAGHSRLAVSLHVSMAAADAELTRRTLEFGTRLLDIRCEPQRNDFRSMPRQAGGAGPRAAGAFGTGVAPPPATSEDVARLQTEVAVQRAAAAEAKAAAAVQQQEAEARIANAVAEVRAEMQARLLAAEAAASAAEAVRPAAAAAAERAAHQRLDAREFTEAQVAQRVDAALSALREQHTVDRAQWEAKRSESELAWQERLRRDVAAAEERARVGVDEAVQEALQRRVENGLVGPLRAQAEAEAAAREGELRAELRAERAARIKAETAARALDASYGLGPLSAAAEERPVAEAYTLCSPASPAAQASSDERGVVDLDGQGAGQSDASARENSAPPRQTRSRARVSIALKPKRVCTKRAKRAKAVSQVRHMLAMTCCQTSCTYRLQLSRHAQAPASVHQTLALCCRARRLCKLSWVQLQRSANVRDTVRSNDSTFRFENELAWQTGSERSGLRPTFASTRTRCCWLAKTYQTALRSAKRSTALRSGGKQRLYGSQFSNEAVERLQSRGFRVNQR